MRFFAGLLAVSLLTAFGYAPAAPATGPAKAPPANSIYQLPLPLTDQDGRAVQLADWQGKPALITMFYTSCEFVCPRIVEALKHTAKKVADDGLGALPVLLVSFDPARDDVATLKKTAAERGITGPAWTLARAEERDVRKLAAMLRIQYRQLPSGDFNHTSVLILVDAEGRVVGRTTTLGEADPVFVKLVEKTLRRKTAG